MSDGAVQRSHSLPAYALGVAVVGTLACRSGSERRRERSDQRKIFVTILFEHTDVRRVAKGMIVRS